MTASATSKLAGFAVALAVLFGIGTLAGGLIDPSPPRSAEAAASTVRGSSGMRTMSMKQGGLAVAANGLRLVVHTPTFASGRVSEFRFHVADDRGRTVRDFDVEQTRRMHVTVVRRDLTGFQHVQPTKDSRGEWSVPLKLDAPGSFRVFVDFSRAGQATTLADDLSGS